MAQSNATDESPRQWLYEITDQVLNLIAAAGREDMTADVLRMAGQARGLHNINDQKLAKRLVKAYVDSLPDY